MIPAYNEAHRLPATLDRLIDELPAVLDIGWQLLVSDDGSLDGTSAVVAERSRDPRVRAITHQVNRGKGAALVAGAVQATTSLVMFLDADLPVSVPTIRAMVDQIGSADLLCGSRHLPGASFDPPQPPLRRVGGRVFRAAVTALRYDVTTDPQCGVKLMRRDRIVPLLTDMSCTGFGFDIELIVRARRAGCTVSEMPVQWRHVEGSSLRPVRDGLSTLAELVALRAKVERAPVPATTH